MQGAVNELVINTVVEFLIAWVIFLICILVLLEAFHLLQLLRNKTFL